MTKKFDSTRYGFCEHVKDGRVSFEAFGLHAWMRLHCYKGKTVTSAPYIALQISKDTKQVQRWLRELKKGGYVREFRVQGRKGNYPILINKFETDGMRLDAYQSRSPEDLAWVPITDRGSDRGTIKSSKGRTEEPWSPKHDYVSDWNNLAQRLNVPLVQRLSSRREKHLRSREQEPSWNWPRLIDELGRVRRAWLVDWSRNGPGLTFDWVIQNDDNYLKILEGKYREKNRGIFG